MKLCVLCGARFHADESWQFPCPDCKEDKAFDTTAGSLHWKILGSLDRLLNSELLDVDLKLIADSHGFSWLVLNVAPVMERQQFVNLLKQIRERTE
jgi:hypothetical protein